MIRKPSLALNRAHLALWLGAAAGLAGCGGGGGDSAAANKPPTAAARLVGEAVLNAATVFDVTGTVDTDGTIVTRSWNYGDGQTGTVDNHVYATTGAFTATYTVTDNQGATAAATVAVTVAKCSGAGTAAAAVSVRTTVCVQTSRGEMVFEINSAQAPITATNFMRYVDDGFFKGTLFHRVINGFVIQGGGFTTGLVAKPPTYLPIVLESNNGLQNLVYTLAMARTNAPDSATSQFFINVVANPGLNYNPGVPGANGYAVFGTVIAGTAVVDTIKGVATGVVNGNADVPLTDVVIQGAVRMP